MEKLHFTLRNSEGLQNHYVLMRSYKREIQLGLYVSFVLTGFVSFHSEEFQVNDTSDYLGEGGELFFELEVRRTLVGSMEYFICTGFYKSYSSTQ